MTRAPIALMQVTKLAAARRLMILLLVFSIYYCVCLMNHAPAVPPSCGILLAHDQRSPEYYAAVCSKASPSMSILTPIFAKRPSKYENQAFQPNALPKVSLRNWSLSNRLARCRLCVPRNLCSKLVEACLRDAADLSSSIVIHDRGSRRGVAGGASTGFATLVWG